VTFCEWDSVIEERVALGKVEGYLAARRPAAEVADHRTQIWLSSGPSSGLLW
jgi:hypothetical protein